MNEDDCETYMVVCPGGAIVRYGFSTETHQIQQLPQGEVVTVVDVQGRRAQIISPVEGWLSLVTKDGTPILKPCPGCRRKETERNEPEQGSYDPAPDYARKKSPPLYSRSEKSSPPSCSRSVVEKNTPSENRNRAPQSPPADHRTVRDVPVPYLSPPDRTKAPVVLNPAPTATQSTKTVANKAPDLLGQGSVDLLGVLDTPAKPAQQVAKPQDTKNSLDNLFSSTASAAPQQVAHTEVWDAFQSSESQTSSNPTAEFAGFQNSVTGQTAVWSSPGTRAGQEKEQALVWPSWTQLPSSPCGNYQGTARPGATTQDSFKPWNPNYTPGKMDAGSKNYTPGKMDAGSNGKEGCRGLGLMTSTTPSHTSKPQQGLPSFVPQLGALFGSSASKNTQLSDLDSFFFRALEGVANMSSENQTAGSGNFNKPSLMQSAKR